jgi:hypothetical protein
MSGYFFDFASQNQKNNHSFKMFFGGVSRQGSFETASVEIFGHTAGHKPAVCPSRGQAAAAKQIARSFETGSEGFVRRLYQKRLAAFGGKKIFLGGVSRHGSTETDSIQFIYLFSTNSKARPTTVALVGVCLFRGLPWAAIAYLNKPTTGLLLAATSQYDHLCHYPFTQLGIHHVSYFIALIAELLLERCRLYLNEQLSLAQADFPRVLVDGGAHFCRPNLTNGSFRQLLLPAHFLHHFLEQILQQMLILQVHWKQLLD